MTKQTSNLGGRLPLLNPKALQPDQQEVYDHIDKTLISWAEKSGFMGKTKEGELIGPFNSYLYSPHISDVYLKFQEAEGKFTTLNERVRQVVILTVGDVWQSDYELYAHTAVAGKAGLSESVIQALAAGRPSDELAPDELTAHRFARQLSAEHRVDADLYREAEQAFGKDGLMNMIYLIGIYLFTCAILNGFDVPAPQA